MDRFIPSLTGIRAIAALWVLVGHYSSYLFEQFGFPKTTLMQPLLLSAWAGVDLFFVLSGFIIAHNYAAGWTSSTKSFSRFLLKRVARLFPVYLITTLAAAGLYLVAILIGHSFNNQSASDLSPLSFVLNLFAVQQWFSVGSLNGPAWSVSAEFFAYAFVFPFLMLSFLSKKQFFPDWAFLLITVSGLMMLPSLEALNPQIWQVSLEFTIGVVTYKIRKKMVSSISTPRVLALKCTAILGAVASIYFGDPTYPNHAFLALFCSAIIVLYSLPGEQKSILAKKPLVRLGYWSYSLYLIHRLIQNITSGLGTLGTSNWLLDTGIFLTLITLAIGLSGLCYRFVEEPCRRYLMLFFDRKTNPSAA